MSEKYESEGRELEITDESTASPTIKEMVRRAILDFFYTNVLAHKLKRISIILKDSEDKRLLGNDIHVFGEYDESRKVIFVYTNLLEINLARGHYRNENEILIEVKGTLAHESTHAIAEEFYQLGRLAAEVSKKLDSRIRKIASEIEVIQHRAVLTDFLVIMHKKQNSGC